MIVSLLVTFVLLALDYWAVARIIAQAGYSRSWLIVPLAPLVLTLIATIILSHEAHDFIFSRSFNQTEFNDLGVIVPLDGLAIFVNWIFFLIFAFSRWPTAQVVAGGPTSANAAGPSDVTPPPLPTPAGGPRFGPSPSGRATPARFARSTTESTAWSSPTASAPVALKHCALCGDPLPGSRALFHDCGPKDRASTFCAACGTALHEPGGVCSTCG